MDSNHEHSTNDPKTPRHTSPPSSDKKEEEPAVIIEFDHLFQDSKRDNGADDIIDNNDDDDDNDPFDDIKGEEEDSLKKSSSVGRMVLTFQQGVRKMMELVDAKFGGYFLVVLFLFLYLVYLCYAMYYRFGDEGSVRLLWCTLLGVVIACRHRAWHVLSKTSAVKWCTRPKLLSTARALRRLRIFTRWLLYVALGAFTAYVVVDVALKDPSKLRSLPGVVAFPFICLLFSHHPSKVNWHTIYWSLGIQFVVAVLVMRWQGGKEVVMWIQQRLDGFFSNSKPASRLMFGDSYTDHYIIFGALPIIFLTNAALSMLYHVGAMQFLVRVIGNCLCFILGTTPIESTAVAASIFMEGVTALLAIRPYLGALTKSELFTLTTACLASIGGAYLAMLAQLGIPVEFLLPAMVISAPATFTVCKLVMPETGKPKKLTFSGDLPPDMQHRSILEAAQAGALSVISLVANVVVSAYALFSLIAWVNTSLTWLGHRVGIQQLTLEMVLSFVFYPFSLLMGIELADCRKVAMLMGLRFASSNFVAILKMAELAENREKFHQYVLEVPNATLTYLGDHVHLHHWNVTLVDGYISKRSEAIATYALCGFSSLLSLFITLSILATLVPKRQPWLVQMSVPLVIAGNLANVMVGCFAGLLVDF